jgi:hypothetical protein
MDRRRSLSGYVRTALEEPTSARDDRVDAAAHELEALASELDDEELVLDPACAVACVRLVSDVASSPLLNVELPAELLRSRVSQIRSGARGDRERRGLDRVRGRPGSRDSGRVRTGRG